MTHIHRMDEPLTGSIPGLVWTKCGEVTGEGFVTDFWGVITCPKCKRAEARDRKRIAALPREAFTYTQDACMALKSAVMRLREIGAVDVAAELEAIRLAADRVKVNMPAMLAAITSEDGR